MGLSGRRRSAVRRIFAVGLAVAALGIRCLHVADHYASDAPPWPVPPAGHSAWTAGGNTTTADANATEDDGGESFSACILWMDDNHRLEEWLAYHYYLLKLRYVVLNIDPWSRTSPAAIIDRWNDTENELGLGMTVVAMTDADYMNGGDRQFREIQRQEEAVRASNDTDTDAETTLGRRKTSYHRNRQKEFYRACARHLMAQNRSWTAFWDTDEFLTFQQEALVDGATKNLLEEGSDKMRRPGYVLDALNEIRAAAEYRGVSCVVVDRRRYCARELALPSLMEEAVPPSLLDDVALPDDAAEDPTRTLRRFDTLRYNFATPGLDGNPKALIDLSRPRVRDFAGGWQVHRPVPACKGEGRSPEAARDVADLRLVLYHYLGDFRSYAFRDDARRGGLRSYDVWAQRANQTEGEFTSVIWPWLGGFVRQVGADAARRLLRDAGRFPADFDEGAQARRYRKTYAYN